MSQENGHICLENMDLFYKYLLIAYLLSCLLVSGKHTLDILGCSVLNKLLGIYLFCVPFSEHLLIPQFGQWFMSSCFPGSNWLDHEE